jgi:hypothetical protein
MPLTPFEKQNIVLNQFDRVIKNSQRDPKPSFIETEIIRSQKASAKFAARNTNKPAAARISFYNPSNPLNGFNGKSRYEQLEILDSLKAASKRKR